MATTGIIGKVYTAPYIQAKTIAFVDSDPDTITDSGNGFVNALFTVGDVTVAGSTSNDGDYTVDAGGVAAGALTLVGTDSLTAESAGDLVTIVSKAPGAIRAGFAGATINQGVDLAEITSFDDGEWKTFAAELKSWTAELDKFWSTVTGGSELLSVPHLFRFFVKYFAIPSGGDVAVYYEGVGIVNNISNDFTKGRVLKEPLSVTGIGELSLKTKSAAW